jgi:hypothetical protein
MRHQWDTIRLVSAHSAHRGQPVTQSITIQITQGHVVAEDTMSITTFINQLGPAIAQCSIASKIQALT